MKRRLLSTEFLWLLLAPTMVLLLFAAYTYIANSFPQQGELKASVTPQVVFPWQQATYVMDFSGRVEKAETAKEEPVDILLAIDVSGSMTSSLPVMADAAYSVSKELSTGKPGLIRFGLISFDSESVINTQWTENPEELRKGLDGLHAFTGQNDTRPAFTRLREMLPKTRSGARRVVVFYTDGALNACGGCPAPAMTESEIVDAAEKLRGEGVKIYSVGLPGHESHPLMLAVTGSSSRVFDPADYRDLANNFRFLANTVLPTLGKGGILSNRLDGRHFAAPIEGTSWRLGASTALELDLASLPTVPTKYAHALKPLSMGLWRVGMEPPRLTFRPEEGKIAEIRASRRPLLLVLTWFTLVPLLLPALVWLVWPRHVKPIREVKLPPPTIRPGPLPVRLPALPSLSEDPRSIVPTLFVGLGGGGRLALQSIRADLKQMHMGRSGRPYRFVSFDLDSRESGLDTTVDGWVDYPIENITAPEAIQRAENYLKKKYELPPHLAWFEAQAYEDIPRANLNLSRGSKGDRQLARYALFHWLDQGGLMDKITRSGTDLLKLQSDDGTRQVIILASQDGGFGSGSLMDFARLFQRFFRKQQASGKNFVPDIIGVIFDDAGGSRPSNREALAQELESAFRCGEFPQRVVHASGRDLLDAKDTESPFYRVFHASERDAVSVAAQCADLAALLVERPARLKLLAEIESLSERNPLPTRLRSIHVTPTWTRELVFFDLLLRMLGPDILLDIEPSPDSGFKPRQTSEENAKDFLREWGAAEPPGSLLQLLFATALDPSMASQFVSEARKTNPQWLGDAFIASVNQRLQGHRDSHGLGWHRDWLPAKGKTVLAFLAKRLETVGDAVRDAGAETVTIEAVVSVKQLASASSMDLNRWISDFCDKCEQLASQKTASTAAHAKLQQVAGRAYVDPEIKSNEIQEWSMECLQKWLKTPDTISPLRERLFFVVQRKGLKAQVVLRSCIAESVDFSTVDASISRLKEMAQTLSELSSVLQLDGALTKIPPKERTKLAERLVDTSTNPVRVLLCTPGRTAGFAKLVPHPPGQGQRADVAGSDPTSVRRAEISSPRILEGREARFVELAEQESERIREKLEQKHRLTVPTFPSELRIALVQPESFKSFSRAYRAGRIVRRPDAVDRMQWYFLDRDQFLTFKADSSLSAAAANYVWYIKDPPLEFKQGADTPDFRGLSRWLEAGGAPDPDTLAMAAIDAYEE